VQGCHERDGSPRGRHQHGHDPHNNGVYSVLSSGGDELDLQRTTKNGQYTDKLSFSFEDGADGTCKIQGCSQSQVGVGKNPP
jgi:hypothetical protein